MSDPAAVPLQMRVCYPDEVLTRQGCVAGLRHASGTTKPGLGLHPHTLLVKPGTHLVQCTVCFDRLEEQSFAQFCFEQYRVTGDGEDISGARHPRKVH